MDEIMRDAARRAATRYIMEGLSRLEQPQVELFERLYGSVEDIEFDRLEHARSLVSRTLRKRGIAEPEVTP